MAAPQITLHLVSDRAAEVHQALLHAASVSWLNTTFQDIERRANVNFWVIKKEPDLGRALEGIMREPGPVLSDLEHGPIRSELEAMCQRAGIRVVNVLDPVIALFEETRAPQYFNLADHQHIPDPRNRLEILADRVGTIADALAELQLNSDEANNSIVRLREVVADIRADANAGDRESSADAVQEEARRILPLLLSIYEWGAGRKAVQMILSGAIAGVLATGWPAAVIFALCMATWDGKDTLRSAIDAFLKGDRGESP